MAIITINPQSLFPDVDFDSWRWSVTQAPDIAATDDALLLGVDDASGTIPDDTTVELPISPGTTYYVLALTSPDNRRTLIRPFRVIDGHDRNVGYWIRRFAPASASPAVVTDGVVESATITDAGENGFRITLGRTIGDPVVSNDHAIDVEAVDQTARNAAAAADSDAQTALMRPQVYIGSVDPTVPTNPISVLGNLGAIYVRLKVDATQAWTRVGVGPTGWRLTASHQVDRHRLLPEGGEIGQVVGRTGPDEADWIDQTGGGGGGGGVTAAEVVMLATAVVDGSDHMRFRGAHDANEAYGLADVVTVQTGTIPLFFIVDDSTLANANAPSVNIDPETTGWELLTELSHWRGTFMGSSIYYHAGDTGETPGGEVYLCRTEGNYTRAQIVASSNWIHLTDTSDYKGPWHATTRYSTGDIFSWVDSSGDKLNFRVHSGDDETVPEPTEYRERTDRTLIVGTHWSALKTSIDSDDASTVTSYFSVGQTWSFADGPTYMCFVTGMYLHSDIPDSDGWLRIDNVPSSGSGVPDANTLPNQVLYASTDRMYVWDAGDDELRSSTMASLRTYFNVFNLFNDVTIQAATLPDATRLLLGRATLGGRNEYVTLPTLAQDIADRTVAEVFHLGNTDIIPASKLPPAGGGGGREAGVIGGPQQVSGSQADGSFVTLNFPANTVIADTDTLIVEIVSASGARGSVFFTGWEFNRIPAQTTVPADGDVTLMRYFPRHLQSSTVDWAHSKCFIGRRFTASGTGLYFSDAQWDGIGKRNGTITVARIS